MKIIIILIGMFWVFLLSGKANANVDYQTFQEITFNEEGKLLESFTDEDYDDYYKEVEKRKFYGWRTYTANNNMSISYISDTLFSYYNGGTSAIEYEYTYTNKDTVTRSISSSGEIKVSSDGAIKKFKNGLDSKLNFEYENSDTNVTSIEENIKMDIDPGCKAVIYISGEGKITNGVGAFYFCWFRTLKGGWECFTSTTQYRRLEKLEI